jgi:LmbE family N-acetylglucosaminyl deacetylase
MPSRRWRPTLLRAVAIPALLALCARADDAGHTPPILQQLRTFANTGTVLHVAAHPDDENTQLITAMARGRGYRAAYLSITRGDGGQNERGPDFAEKLGLLRTQELLAARRHDGGRQFFTRAIDYGYSKSPEEALRIWDHAAVLGDVVRVIRTFRPDVIITRFPIPPGSGGHGQHTASAMLAVEAFKLAADPAAYPDQIRDGLAPWQAKRIGWNAWGNNSPLKGPTIQFDIGGVDPVTGVPFGTIANQSRGMHKTQTLGRFSEQAGSAGPNLQTFLLLAGDAPTNDIMDGVDTTWARVPGGGALVPLINDAIAKFNPADPAASVPALLVVHDQLDKLTQAHPLVEEKLADLDRIIASCLGLTVETTVPQAEVVSGNTLEVTHAVTLRATSVPVRFDSIFYPRDQQAQAKVGELLKPGAPLVRTLRFPLHPMSPISQPYWLEREGSPGMFHVEDLDLIGQPENPRWRSRPISSSSTAAPLRWRTNPSSSSPAPRRPSSVAASRSSRRCRSRSIRTSTSWRRAPASRSPSRSPPPAMGRTARCGSRRPPVGRSTPARRPSACPMPATRRVSPSPSPRLPPAAAAGSAPWPRSTDTPGRPRARN